MSEFFFDSRIETEGQKNALVVCQGCIVFDREGLIVVTREEMNPVPKGLRIDEITWLIEEKMTLRLWWGDRQKFVIPMESRNKVPLPGCHSPKDWDGTLTLEALNVAAGNNSGPKYFTLILDLEKT